MTTTRRIAAVLLTGGLLAWTGCRDQTPPPPPPPPEPTVEAEPEEVTLQDVTDTAGAYASQQTEKLMAASKEHLAAMQVKFSELKARAATEGEDAEAQLATLKERFDAKVAEAEAKLAEFREANAPRAEQLKEDVSRTVGEVGTIFRDAWSRYGGGDADTETPPEDVTPESEPEPESQPASP